MESSDDYINQIKNTADLKSADKSIGYNLLSQVIIAVVLVIVFFILRPFFEWLYSPNIINRRMHPAYYFKGRFSWFKPIIDISDTQLLSLIGLDSFMMLQIMKLLHRILLVISFLTFPMVGFFYITSNDGTNKQLFLRLSISSITKESKTITYLVFPLINIITIMVLYIVYIYYKEYIVLRQAYIRNPSLFTAIQTIKKLQYKNGSIERAIDFINIQTKTLFFCRLPSFLKNDQDFKKYIRNILKSPIKDCCLIRENRQLSRLIFKREKYIRSIEASIHQTLKKMNIWSKRNIDECRLKISSFEGDSILEAASRNIESNFSMPEKVKLFSEFLHSFDHFMDEKKNFPFIEFYLEKLKEINSKIYQEIKNLNNYPENSNVIELIQNDDYISRGLDELEEESFFPLKKLFNTKMYYRNFVEDIPYNRKSGFVTFESQKSSSYISQSLISSRIFSVKATKAPSPNDVIWFNLNTGSVNKYFGNVISFFFFVAFNIVFLTTVVFVASLVRIGFFFKLITGKDLPSYINNYISTMDGILTPFIYNQFLGMSPILLTVFLRKEGIISFSRFQIKLTKRYSLFLFFNGFVAMFFSSTFLDIIINIYSKEGDFMSKILEEFTGSLMKTSMFFYNSIIQRCIVGNIFLLVKPVNLFIYLFANLFQGNKTRREKIESRFPENLNFSIQYPILFLVFPMCLIYCIISPLISVIGSLHFFTAYILLKNEFIYVASNEFESGGAHWNIICDQIIYSVIYMQFVMIAQLISLEKRLLSLAVIIPISFTIYFKRCLNKMFEKSTKYHPISIQEEGCLDKFIEQYIKKRSNILNNWEEPSDYIDEDSLVLKSLDDKDVSGIQDIYPYKRPGISGSLSKILMPKDFFKVIKFLTLNDKDNIFKAKKESK